tara:strand:+ start:108 stop:233 length:126 start_codon:yes stop_codon:yes gene_type:complete
MEFFEPLMTEDALLTIPTVAIVYVVLFFIASIELRQTKYKD